MANFAIVENGIVKNVILADSKKIADKVTEKDCIEYSDENPAYIGGAFIDGVFFAPVVVDETISE